MLKWGKCHWGRERHRHLTSDCGQVGRAVASNTRGPGSSPVIINFYGTFFLNKMGQSRPLFVYFRYFLNTISIIQIEKSVDGVLGIRTRGRRMVGAEENKELWRPPWDIYLLLTLF